MASVETAYGSTDGVVLIINSVDCDINVAATRTIDAKNCDAIFRRVIRVYRFCAGCKISQIAEVTSIER